MRKRRKIEGKGIKMRGQKSGRKKVNEENNEIKQRREKKGERKGIGK